MTENRLVVSLDVTAVPVSPAGAGRYTVELATAMAQRDDVDLVLLSRRDDRDRWVGHGGVVSEAPRARPFRLAWEQVAMPGVLRRIGPAVHHGPHYTMPERSDVPIVVTVHDCTFFDHPEWHERTKAYLFRRAIRVAVQRAAVIVCVSATTAARLDSVTSVRAPIMVVPHGVDHTRFTPDDPGGDAELLLGLGVPSTRPYVLFLGTVEPRKNVASLLEAFGRIASTHPDALLVLAGGPGWGTTDVDAALAKIDAARVIRCGYVSDAAVPALLRRARVVAYPSLSEGYGLPALEALACGAPLVTTSGTAMAEFAAGAAMLVEPGDTEELAGALDGALVAEGDPDRRKRGVEIAATRTWEASAEGHMAAYRRAVDGPSVQSVE